MIKRTKLTLSHKSKKKTRMLKRGDFRRNVVVLALRVPTVLVESVMRPLQGHGEKTSKNKIFFFFFLLTRGEGMRRPNLKPILADPLDRTKRIFLLEEGITAEAIPESVQKVRKAFHRLFCFVCSYEGSNRLWLSTQMWN